LPALLEAHRALAETLEDKSKLAMYYCWTGVAMFHTESLPEAHSYLNKALRLGETTRSHQVVAHASLWLSWVCSELGLLDEAIGHSKKARDLGEALGSEDLYCLALSGLGQAYWYRGETAKTRELGQSLLAHGERTGNPRGTVLGYYIIGCSHLTAGDFFSAAESFRKSISFSADPYYSQWPRMLLCLTYALNGQNLEAESLLQEVLRFTGRNHVPIIGTPARSIMGIVMVGKGHLREGIQAYEEGRQSYLKHERRWCYALSEYILGTIYLQILSGWKGGGMHIKAGDVLYGFMKLPFLRRKAEAHLNRSIEAARAIGARMTVGMAQLSLGLLHKSAKKTDSARTYLSEASMVFDRCGAGVYLSQAEEALESLRERP
jgi:tetratricopeptide (TPR) repeat protein